MGHNGADQTENMVSKYSAAGKANDYIRLQMLDNNGGSPPNCILIKKISLILQTYKFSYHHPNQ